MSTGSAKYMVNDPGVGVPLRLGGTVSTQANGTKIKYCLPLMTGLFNLDKYIPLLMCQSGIDVDIFLEDPGNCGAVNIVSDGNAVADGQWQQLGHQHS